MWRFIKSIPRSTLALVVTFALGLLSMGLLGAGLYYAVFFALPSSFPHIDSIGGDWVWPAVIVIGMLWSIGFLMAGWLNNRLVARGTKAALRRVVYVSVLWLWAYALWAIAIFSRPV
jgi:hypothetical protein